MKIKILLLIWMLSLIGSTQAQVVINEYSASNLEGFTDSYGKTEDWIELYNTDNFDIDISGWHLSDKESKPLKYEIPAGTVLSGNSFLVFYCSGRDIVYFDEYHTNFKLSQTKNNEIVLLSDAEGEIIEMHPMDLTLVENSLCRDTDGGDNWVVCTNPSLGSSNNGSNHFSHYTATPSMDLVAGFYNGAQTIEITNNEPDSELRYTVNGDNVTQFSPLYEDPIIIESTTILKARSFSGSADVLPGKMDFNTYFIDENFSLAVFSVGSDSVIHLANGDGDIIPIGSLEYFNKDDEREATSFGSLNRHGQDSWILDHRSIDWVSRDEMGYSRAVKAELFSYSERDSYQKFMFRNSGDDNYPANDDSAHEGSAHIRDEYVQTLGLEGGMELDQRAVERVIVFLNGEYWGVYGMRERPVDHDYTKEYYDQGKYDIQYLSTWGDTEIQYGGNQAIVDWVNLRNFILESDMSIEDNYELASDSLNMTSLIDYMIVNLNVVASDWLNYNTGWWRGRDPEGKHKKWGYILWDLDATFDYYINYSGVPNISPDADPCDLEDIGEYMDWFFSFGVEDVGQHEKIFLKLLEESPIFKQLYYSRQADMMNTVFNCENMLTTLQTMLNVIGPEMPRQIERWGGTMEEWQSNVHDLKSFIQERCELLDDGMLECYEELNGPYPLTLQVQPEGVGKIKINTIYIDEFPWSGDYFGGMDNKIKAKLLPDYEDSYEFSHWISTNGNVITPNVAEDKAWINLTQIDTLTAVFELIVSVNEIDNPHALKAFPNPANEYIHIDYNIDMGSIVELKLYSILGEELILPNMSLGYKGSGNHSKELDLRECNLSDGLYILSIESNGFSSSIKINISN